MDPWAVAVLVVAVAAVIGIAAWDTARSLVAGGRGAKKARDRRAAEAAKYEMLHDRMHPDERKGEGPE